MDVELTQLRGVALIRNVDQRFDQVYCCCQSLEIPATKIFLTNYDAVFVCDTARMAYGTEKLYVCVQKLGECGWVASHNLRDVPQCTREVRNITIFYEQR